MKRLATFIVAGLLFLAVISGISWLAIYTGGD